MYSLITKLLADPMSLVFPGNGAINAYYFFKRSGQTIEERFILFHVRNRSFSGYEVTHHPAKKQVIYNPLTRIQQRHLARDPLEKSHIHPRRSSRGRKT